MFINSVTVLKQLTVAMALSVIGTQALAAGALAIDGHQGGHFGFASNLASIDKAEQKAMKDWASAARSCCALRKVAAPMPQINPVSQKLTDGAH